MFVLGYWSFYYNVLRLPGNLKRKNSEKKILIFIDFNL